MYLKFRCRSTAVTIDVSLLDSLTFPIDVIFVFYHFMTFTTFNYILSYYICLLPPSCKCRELMNHQIISYGSVLCLSTMSHPWLWHTLTLSSELNGSIYLCIHFAIHSVHSFYMEIISSLIVSGTLLVLWGYFNIFLTYS